MIIVTIGLSLQIHKEIQERKVLQEQVRQSNGTLEIPIEKSLPAGISTLYLAGLSGIFVFAAFMHPKEALCLMNGIWYLLCLPSGYLLLTVYSVVNMTDRSWGKSNGFNIHLFHKTLSQLKGQSTVLSLKSISRINRPL